MIRIHKRQPPTSLTQYRRECLDSLNRGVIHLLDDFLMKGSLRRQLAEEQGYLCAYCLQRISADPLDTKIEHVIAQTLQPLKQLDYDNLLLCCKGNEGQSENHHHCDTKKKDMEIKYNPASYPNIEDTIRYKRNGTIISDDQEWDQQLNDVLNLNETRLRENRKAAENALIEELGRKLGTRTKGKIDHMIVGLTENQEYRREVETLLWNTP